MIITRTPLRISLLGGNTDFKEYYEKHGGMCLTTTIDKYVFCIVRKRFDDEIRLSWSEKETVTKVDDLKHELVREAMKLTGVEKGIEIVFLSDIPAEGSGLGSSSAVTVGVLNALHAYRGKPAKARQLAEEACHIEIDILKKPIGVQDQYACAFGGLNRIYMDDKFIDVENLKADATLLERSLILFHTGVSRKSKEILKDFKLNKELLDQNKELCRQAINALRLYNINTFAGALHAYWLLKKEMNSKTSNTEIDEMYQEALNWGALGGKVVGAGGGGFLLVVVDNEHDRRRVINALGPEKELKFHLEPEGSKVIFNV